MISQTATFIFTRYLTSQMVRQDIFINQTVNRQDRNTALPKDGRFGILVNGVQTTQLPLNVVSNCSALDCSICVWKQIRKQGRKIDFLLTMCYYLQIDLDLKRKRIELSNYQNVDIRKMCLYFINIHKCDYQNNFY